MKRTRVRRAVVSAVVAIAGLAAVACGRGGSAVDAVSRPFGDEDCQAVADVAAEHDDPVRRRQAVVEAVKAGGLDDAAYRELAETCVRLQCPGPSPSPVTPNPGGAPLPVDHADLGPDAPWPCATGDIL